MNITMTLRSSRIFFLQLPLLLLLLLLCLAVVPLQVSAWMSFATGKTATTRITISRSLAATASRNAPFRLAATTTSSTESSSSSSWFANPSSSSSSSDATNNKQQQQRSLEQRKAELLQLGAALDRGQAYNPTSGPYYKDRMDAVVDRLDALVQHHANHVPTSLQEMAGEWELVLTTVPHGIFRSSPFFLAIQQAYEQDNDNNRDKANLFFKLHELQTCSWGASKIGRVAQTITESHLYSEFDTSLFSLTVIPIVGWFKLLPTFGGCVVTAARAELVDPGVLSMKVEYTTAVPVPGLQGLLGNWIWNVKVPVGAIWKRLPWNKGREACCQVFVRFCDDDFRIVQDVSGDYFVYTRPVLPRPLELTAMSEDDAAAARSE